MECETITGVRLPAIGIGTWDMGRARGPWQLAREKPDYSNDEKCIEAIKEAIKLGMWHIDTAEMYSSGHAEEIVGAAIRDVPRKKVFITTKVLPNHLKHDDLIVAANASLKRLQLEYVDLYLIHWVNSTSQIKEAMAAMDELVAAGKVKHIGVSNFTPKQLQLAQSCTKNRIVTNQVEYNLLSRGCEKELLPYCQDNEIILTAYSPLAQGKLPKNKILAAVAEKHDKTIAQVALNWLISHKNVIAIPKASSLEHVRENAGAAGWKLTAEDLAAIEKEF